MTPFILYQVKVAVSIALFTLLYYLLFRKETFYRLNRIYLILSLLISGVLPLIRIPEFNPPTVQAVTGIINSVTVVTGNSAAAVTAEKTPVIVILYRTMMVVFVLQLMYQICRLLVAAIRKGSIKVGRYRIISLSRKSQSFSFFNLIFIASPIHDETGQNQILRHEMAHAGQWHSADILIIQIFKIFQWFNPFIYLAEKALQETHEYLADEAVLEQDGDSNGYRLLLLTRVFGVQPGIVSLFNYSLIKNRMIMMTKEKSPLRNRFKYFIFLPIALLIGFGLSCTNKDDVVSESTRSSDLLPPPPPPPPMSPDEANAGIDPSKITDNDTMFIMVDKQATFRGGTMENFREWVQKNVNYPEKDVKNGISGKVYVQFIVNSKGQLSSVKVLRGVSLSLDQEVVRVISSSPDWEPGSYKGYPVKQQFVMPVEFALASEKASEKIDEKVLNKEEPAFVHVDQLAKFQGGSLETFREWVQKNLNYPQKAIENGISGRVTVQFTVDKMGNVSSIKVLRGVDPMLDTEAVRTISSSPRWEPAVKDNRIVAEQFVIPVIFALQ